MNEFWGTAIRLMIILGVVMLLPVLAMPNILARVDEWRFGQEAPPAAAVARKPAAELPKGHQRDLVDGSSFEPMLAQRARSPSADQPWLGAPVLATPPGSEPTVWQLPRDESRQGSADADQRRPLSIGAPARSPTIQQIYYPSDSVPVRAGTPDNNPSATASEDVPGSSPPGYGGAGPSEIVTGADGQSETAVLGSLNARLKQLGASYLLLERADGAAGGFRFRCRVDWPENPASSRPFEAVASSPVDAVRAVLADVERWRGGF